MKSPSIKSKIKNFFTISEDDLREEECTKTFKNTTWFALSKNQIFYGILAFMLLIDILVSFNLTLFYARAVLSFLFIAIIPGLLIMLIMKIREINFWEYLVYTIGLSISFIMFAGLAVNWILPWLNITNKPLSTTPILICFNVFLLTFWIIAKQKNKDLKPFKIQFPKLDALNTVMFTIPMFFPILAILGAFLLNNHGISILTMIMLGGIAFYVFAIVFFRKRLNTNIYPWVLYSISLSLLLMGWMRSWNVSGVDANLEYWVFRLCQESGRWALSNYYNAYNAMLSLNILPTVFYNLIGGLKANIFKLYFQIIFSTIPVIIYLFIKSKFSGIIGFLSALFFLIQPIWITGYGIAIRQNFSFLFFALIILVIFSNNLKNVIGKLLIIIFTSSLIVSHYSTAYISMLLLIIIATLAVYRKNLLENEKVLSILLIILLLLFGFLWYSQLTPVSGGLNGFLKKSISNIGNMFSEDVQLEGHSFFENINPFNGKVQGANILEDYKKTLNNDYNKVNPRYSIQLSGYSSEYNSLSISFQKLKTFLIAISRLLIVLGVSALFFYKKDPKIKIFSIVSFIIFIILVFMPYSSIYYDLPRLFQQMLMFFGFLLVIGILSFPQVKKKYKITILTIFLTLYFISLLGFFLQFSGGLEISSKLNNYGMEYDQYYISNSEIMSSRWIFSSKNQKIIHADSYANLALILDRPFKKNYQVYHDILPEIISKESYIYLDSKNKFAQLAMKPYRAVNLIYKIDFNFLNNNKNKIYNNGDSEIFK